MGRAEGIPGNVIANSDFWGRNRKKEIYRWKGDGETPGWVHECLFHVIWQTNKQCTFVVSYPSEPGNYKINYAISDTASKDTDEQYLDMGWPMTWTVTDCAENGHTHILKDGHNRYGDESLFKIYHYEGNPNGGFFDEPTEEYELTEE